MNWIDTTVGEFCPFIYGKGLPKTKRQAGEYPVYGSNGCVDFHNDFYIDGPGIIIGRKGSVGAVHLSTQPFWPIDTAFYVTKGTLGELRFTYYLLKSLGLEKMNSDSAVPGLNRDNAHALSIRIPESPESRESLGNQMALLDEKIAANSGVNQTLEDMAQAIFKSWFVDFDPVKAKMNGEQPEGMDAGTASLFPEKLVDTDMGEIPEGWQLVPVGKLLSKTIGGDWGKEEPDAKHTEEVRIVRGTDIPKLHGGAIESVPVRYVEAKKLKTRKLERGDIVIEVSGGSKDQPTGRSLFISDNILKRLELPSEPASFCRRFQPVNYEVGLLLAVHFQLMYKAGKTWEYQNQSTGISNFQTTYFLEAEHVVVPSQEVLDAFVKQVSPMMDMIHSNQNIELAKLRDTLLPKLLSGEINLTSEVVA
ncbi:TPA: restriction endonuclease subunit S [Vibrio parahaemolyticus]|nr:restriction endonuclease subunit S [Vibrio parahaemolyticus]HCE2448390.1 restriction endonuclease subunit S [Vibrio parahaemolyticus]